MGPVPAAAASSWAGRSLPDLLDEHGLAGIPEQPFPNDGWSGATLTALDGPAGRFILKRTSWAADWIARSTRDHALREAVLAAEHPALPYPTATAHLGAAADGTAAAILMPDLSASLIAWDRPGEAAAIIDDETLDRVLFAVATIHAFEWASLPGRGEGAVGWPWCPVRERVELLTRSAALRYQAGGLPVGERFLAGWDAFDELAPSPAVDLIAGLAVDSGPLLRALSRLPATGLHGDLKLANVALLPDGRTAFIDWQMAAWAPVAVELGWLLVSNVAQLRQGPDQVLERYRLALATATAAAGQGAAGSSPDAGNWGAQRDLAILVGLLLRGWRKGLDAAAGESLPTGTAAADDLRWWGDEAVEAAKRRL